eukprot:CAMPEP_0116079308 /NCGR_PEP_ID=MMETSP0327-20121206/1072_1 /TAXON_ID=44447 /ORGANISM="Pseudo-nitzschia delicatissima, Strain B596" /LENGTH=726 /DNA_ID=CAMNT_0003569923 /DNA_START=3015 /DNA_END=5195 /DNA_ORIENTATION=-
MPASRRGKRRRSNTNANGNNSKTQAGRKRENNKAEDSDEGDDTEVHVLDGVEYKNYNDFVIAKRQRNEKYLRELGFDSNEKKRKNRTRSSNSDSKETEADATAETTIESVSSKRAKLVSPSSTYYETYVGDDGAFGISLDGASLDTDPFDDISNLLLGLEREQKRALRLLSKLETFERNNVEGEFLTEKADSGRGGTIETAAVPSSKSTNELQERAAAGNRGESGADELPTESLAEVPEDRKESVTGGAKKSKLSIRSLLEKMLSFLSPASISGDNSIREKHLDVFYQLKGIPIVLRLLVHYQEEGEPECCGIVILCLQILRDSCSLSAVPDNRKSAAEKVALDFVLASGLEILHTMISTLKHVVESGSKSSKSRRGRSTRRLSKAKQHNALEIIRNAWCVYANLTYFESVTAFMGKKDILDLADRAYWTLTALDYHVTEKLATILPPVTAEAGHETKSSSKKRGRKTTSMKSRNKITTEATASTEVVEQSKNVLAEASPILEPVLGTMRNLVADPIATRLDWEATGLVSKLLDVLCKGDEDSNQPSITEPNMKATENDWLHFVKELFHSTPQETQKIAAAVTPTTTVFRWMEQSESAVWELLGIFKVCLGKGILYLCINDVERLVTLWIRCLRRFGGSSSRIVLRILGLVYGLVFPSSTMNIVYGEVPYSSSAEIRKQILFREGFLNELLDLSSRHSSFAGRGCLPSNRDIVRTEVETMIERLRN